MKVSIVGAGAMGSGIAQVAAAAGESVLLFDTRTGAAEAALGSIRKRFEQLASKGRMTAADAAAASQRLAAATALSDFANAGLVIEAVIEDLAVKRQLFQSLDAIVAADCLLATNTSSLSLAAIATALRAPERLVGMHFFNPAPLMALVEVVGSVVTAPAALDAIERLAVGWGKSPVRVRATPGFIVNRVARPYYAEGLRLLAEQATDPATLDALLRDAGGFRMGPCELTDLIGQDVNFAVTCSVFHAYFGDPRFQPSLVQQELVEAGWLGRKSGRGFFRYGESAAPPQPQVEPPHPKPDRIAIAGTPGSDALTDALAARIGAAGINVTREPRLPTDTLLQVTDGRTALECELAAGDQPQPTVVADLALDYGTVKRLALAVSPHCGPGAWASVAGALQAAGIAVVRLRDLPALAVMRTVAMLANEAADAVHFGVADATSVDLAMRKGVNYPLGPLEWAHKIGLSRIHAVLAALGAFYGEDRYRISPFLRQQVLSGRFHVHE
ncbi:MAG: 3-hydroxyacyl-CoA dehydrogenase [Acidobacteria bacterium]|nr:MAG: 3-hydroxyacyl-CoA dehydrogenase [Acidobacteriota bacterium]